MDKAAGPRRENCPATARTKPTFHQAASKTARTHGDTMLPACRQPSVARSAPDRRLGAADFGGWPTGDRAQIVRFWPTSAGKATDWLGAEQPSRVDRVDRQTVQRRAVMLAMPLATG